MTKMYLNLFDIVEVLEKVEYLKSFEFVCMEIFKMSKINTVIVYKNTSM